METRTRAVLERPDLVNRVRAALFSHAMVYIQAPLGYGKTTLARSVVNDRDDVAWYEAAPWDAASFVGPLVDAVRGVRPHFGRRTLALLEERAQPDRLGASFAGEFVNVDRPIVLVIDDAHVLDADAFASFTDALIRRLPASARVLVASRAAAPFALAEARATDRAAAFGPHDLRFVAADIAELSRLYDVSLDERRAEALAARTDGWPAGIALALRTGAQSLPALTGSPDAASAYLVEALLAKLAVDDVALLESLCAYESIDAGLLATLDASTRARLVALERSGAMISLLAGGDGFRFHPILRETLFARVRARGAGECTALDTAAARQYAALGRTAPAMFHLERSGDPAAMLAFLRGFAMSAMLGGHVERVAALAARVRGAGLDDPALSGFIAAYRRKVRAAEGIREAFVEARDAADAQDAALLSFAARVQIVEYDLSRGADVERAAIDDLLVRAAALGPAERAAAAVRAGWFDVVAGRFEAGLAYAADAPDTGSALERSFVVPLRAYAHSALGLFAEADREMSALLASLEAESPKLLASTLGWAARFALLRGETTAAWEYAQQAARLAEPFDFRSEAAALAISLGEAAIHHGDTERALEAAEAAERFADDAWYIRDVARVRRVAHQLRVRAQLLRAWDVGGPGKDWMMTNSVDGDAVTAATMADAAWFAVTFGLPHEHVRAAVRAAIESVVPADGADVVALTDAADALAFLDRYLGEDRPAPVVLAGPFASLVAARATAPRLAPLGTILANARTNPREAVRFADGLRAYTARGPRFEAAMAAGLARTIAVEPPAPAPPSALHEPLTPREAEILDLLVAGLTNKEIAQRLIVSARTAETHVARVLGKLGVTSRARAIAKAIALGLAAPPTEM